MMSTRTTGRVSSVAAAFIAAAVLVAGATAPAYADPASDTPVKAEGKAPKEQRYCVKPQVATGTILVSKTCRTRAEWIAKTGVDPATAK